MKNPYEVLGIDPSASIDDIKNAYRIQARRYNENPTKMREIDEAYDELILNFSKGKSTGSTGSYTQYQQASGTTSEFGDIRAKLNSGRIDDAEMLLDGIPQQRRNAEWYYLKGTIQHRRGWLESAAESFAHAHQLEPNNPEYDAAYKQLNREKKGEYRAERNRRSNENSGCSDPCNICTGLLCADCCCECMGGDLIRCC